MCYLSLEDSINIELKIKIGNGGYSMKKGRRPSSKDKKLVGSLKKRISGFALTPEFKSRIRWILFVLAFLLLFLGFEVGDDWFVREFANYDWARSIGY